MSNCQIFWTTDADAIKDGTIANAKFAFGTFGAGGFLVFGVLKSTPDVDALSVWCAKCS